MPDERRSRTACLPWDVQVAELRKIQMLSPSEFEGRPQRTRRLSPPAEGAAARCVVCGAATDRLCSACGAVGYCTEAHRERDDEWHARVCEQFREIAEDEALLATRSADDLAAELVLRRCASNPSPAPANWDEYLGRFGEGDAALRRVTCALASRPATLAYAMRRLGIVPSGGRFRVHIVASAGREIRGGSGPYEEIVREWPGVRFEIAFVGPELPLEQCAAWTPAEHIRGSFHRLPYRRALWDGIGRPDLVIGFDCGLLLYPTWRPTVLDLFGHELPFVVTSHRAWEQAAEVKLLESLGASVLFAAPNPFSSPSANRSTTLVNDVCHDNAHVMALSLARAKAQRGPAV